MNAVDKKESFQVDQQLNDALLSGALSKELGLGERELGLALGVANLKLRSGNPSKALQMYAMLVLCKPTNVDFQCALANCALQLQEYEVALQAASAVVAMAPADCRGYYFSGAACLGLGQFGDAKEDIVDAITFAENSPHQDIHAACLKLNTQLKSKLS